jgi:Fe-S cluster assembly iron-binding protein IscA
MLTLTPNATEAVKLVSTSFGAKALRISSRAGSPGEFDLTLVSQPEEYDLTIEQDGANVFIDLKSSVELEDQALDAHIGDGGAPEFGVVPQ